MHQVKNTIHIYLLPVLVLVLVLERVLPVLPLLVDSVLLSALGLTVVFLVVGAAVFSCAGVNCVFRRDGVNCSVECLEGVATTV